MFIQLAATHERANSTTFGTRAPREQRQRQEHLFCQRTYARLARVVPFVEVFHPRRALSRISNLAAERLSTDLSDIREHSAMSAFGGITDIVGTLLLPPEILEPHRRKFGVAHRMLDILVAQIGLQRSGANYL